MEQVHHDQTLNDLLRAAQTEEGVAFARSLSVLVRPWENGRDAPVDLTPVSKPPRRPPGFVRIPHRFDVDLFAALLAEALRGKLHGYAVAVQRLGRVILQQASGKARNALDGNIAFTTSTTQHVASVSKWLTAATLMKALALRGIGLDTAIGDFLPPYWDLGPGSAAISFRQLLAHTSGLAPAELPGRCDLVFAREMLEGGTPGPSATGVYANVNYVLCRILLPGVLNQPSPFLPAWFGGFLLETSHMDLIWDAHSAACYQRAAMDTLFNPGGVSARGFSHDDAALAYQRVFDPVNGWNSGEKAGYCGTTGWHLSVLELLAIARVVRRPAEPADRSRWKPIFSQFLGLDPDLTIDTAMGRIQGKGGFWSDGNGRTEQAALLFAPGGIEVAFIANSPIDRNSSAQWILIDCVKRSIVPSIIPGP